MIDKIGTAYMPVSITFSKTVWRYCMHWYKKDYNEHTQKYHYFYYPMVFVSPFVTGMDTSREKDFPQAKGKTYLLSAFCVDREMFYEIDDPLGGDYDKYNSIFNEIKKSCLELERLIDETISEYRH